MNPLLVSSIDFEKYLTSKRISTSTETNVRGTKSSARTKLTSSVNRNTSQTKNQIVKYSTPDCDFEISASQISLQGRSHSLHNNHETNGNHIPPKSQKKDVISPEEITSTNNITHSWRTYLSKPPSRSMSKSSNVVDISNKINKLKLHDEESEVCSDHEVDLSSFMNTNNVSSYSTPNNLLQHDTPKKSQEVILKENIISSSPKEGIVSNTNSNDRRILRRTFLFWKENHLEISSACNGNAARLTRRVAQGMLRRAWKAWILTRRLSFVLQCTYNNVLYRCMRRWFESMQDDEQEDSLYIATSHYDVYKITIAMKIWGRLLRNGKLRRLAMAVVHRRSSFILNKMLTLWKKVRDHRIQERNMEAQAQQRRKQAISRLVGSLQESGSRTTAPSASKSTPKPVSSSRGSSIGNSTGNGYSNKSSVSVSVSGRMVKGQNVDMRRHASDAPGSNRATTQGTSSADHRWAQPSSVQSRVASSVQATSANDNNLSTYADDSVMKRVAHSCDDHQQNSDIYAPSEASTVSGSSIADVSDEDEDDCAVDNQQYEEQHHELHSSPPPSYSHQSNTSSSPWSSCGSGAAKSVTTRSNTPTRSKSRGASSSASHSEYVGQGVPQYTPVSSVSSVSSHVPLPPNSSKVNQLQMRAKERREKLAATQKVGLERAQKKKRDQEEERRLKAAAVEEQQLAEMQRYKTEQQEARRRGEYETKKKQQEMQQNSKHLQRVLEKADRHYSRRLLVVCALSPWLKLVQMKREYEETASAFQRERLLRRMFTCLSAFARASRTERARLLERKSMLATAHYRTKLMRTVWGRLVRWKRLLRAKATAVFTQMSKFSPSRRAFAAWRLALERHLRLLSKKMHEVAPRGDQCLLRHVWRLWSAHVEQQRLQHEISLQSDIMWAKVRSWMDKS